MAARGARTIRAGFTLVELVMVLAIIAVVAAIAAPRWGRSMARWHADAAARRLCADLAWAQSRARITSSSQTLQINPSTGQYQLLGVADPDHPAAVYTVSLGQSPYASTVSSPGWSGGPLNVVFDGYGNPAGSTTLVIQSGDFQRTVTVNPGANSTGGAGIAGSVSLQ